MVMVVVIVVIVVVPVVIVFHCQLTRMSCSAEKSSVK